MTTTNTRSRNNAHRKAVTTLNAVETAAFTTAELIGDADWSQVQSSATTTVAGIDQALSALHASTTIAGTVDVPGEDTDTLLDARNMFAALLTVTEDESYQDGSANDVCNMAHVLSGLVQAYAQAVRTVDVPQASIDLARNNLD